MSSGWTLCFLYQAYIAFCLRVLHSLYCGRSCPHYFDGKQLETFELGNNNLGYWAMPENMRSELRRCPRGGGGGGGAKCIGADITLTMRKAAPDMMAPAYTGHYWRSIFRVKKQPTHYTASSHISRPYTTAFGSSFANTCPICPHYYSSSPAPRDTIDHWLGGCTRPIRISSHLIPTGQLFASFIPCSPVSPQGSSWYTIMAAPLLPYPMASVAPAFLSAWLLPTDPPDVLRRLRPDMLIIHGLDLQFLLSTRSPPSFLHLTLLPLLYLYHTPCRIDLHL